MQRRGGVEEGKRCRKLGDEGKIKVKWRSGERPSAQQESAGAYWHSTRRRQSKLSEGKALAKYRGKLVEPGLKCPARSATPYVRDFRAPPQSRHIFKWCFTFAEAFSHLSMRASTGAQEQSTSNVDCPGDWLSLQAFVTLSPSPSSPTISCLRAIFFPFLKVMTLDIRK